MVKRTSGEGTLYKTKRGKYRAQIIINGRRNSKTADTARECREWLREQHSRLNFFIDLDRAKDPLNQFLDDWLVTVKNTKSTSTYVTYESSLRNHVRPYFGEIIMEDIKPQALQIIIDRLFNERKKNKAIYHAYRILKSALNQAVSLRILEYNPMDGVILPRKKRQSGRKLHVWDETQVQAYLVAIDLVKPRNSTILKLAVGTGLRLAELLALMWKDIDFAANEISIVRQSDTVHRTNKNDTSPPKTESSVRTIRVGNSLIADLMEQKNRTDFEMRYYGWKDNLYCFPSQRGNIISATTARNLHIKILKAAELPEIRFHDLRHTAVSLMLKQGVPITEVSQYVGHSTTTMTLDIYGHFLPNWESKAASAMDQIMTPVSVDL